MGYGGRQEHFFPRRVDIEEDEEIPQEGAEVDPNKPIGKLIRSVRVFCGPQSTLAITGLFLCI